MSHPSRFPACSAALLLALALCPFVSGAEPTPAQRIADTEAYLKNAARGEHSAVPGPGPGHNAWMMTSSALVLFMTLAGLALFYSGLVRRKNVLSVVAQCLGLALGSGYASVRRASCAREARTAGR